MFPVTPQGDAIARLFLLAMGLSAVVFLLVAGLLAVALVRFRARGEGDDPAPVEGNRRLEVAWTAAPLALLALLFVLAVRTLGAIEAEAAAPLRVEVVGHQWWWEYRYPDLGVATANELHLPTDTPLRLEITAADVIHSFWVPAFGWKSDAVPGKVNVMRLEVTQAGRFDGACTEYCGAQHAWMRVDVLAEPRGQFDAWVAAQRADAAASADPVAQRGRALFLSNTCVSCHTVRGTPANGRVGPELTHVGSRPTLGAGVLPNTRQDMRRWLAAVQDVKPGALMPAYPGLAAADLDALAAYLEGLK